MPVNFVFNIFLSVHMNVPRYNPIKLHGDGPTASEIVIRDRDRFYGSEHRDLALREAGQIRPHGTAGEEPLAVSDPMAPSRFKPIRLRGDGPTASEIVIRDRDCRLTHVEIKPKA